jgi:hypothetical protein
MNIHNYPLLTFIAFCKVNAALMFDAVNVISDALNRLLTEKPFLFSSRLTSYYNHDHSSSFGIDCSKQYPIAQWKHGKLISDYLKKVPLSLFTRASSNELQSSLTLIVSSLDDFPRRI